jgi:hypothetical protein
VGGGGGGGGGGVGGGGGGELNETQLGFIPDEIFPCTRSIKANSPAATRSVLIVLALVGLVALTKYPVAAHVSLPR